MATAMDHRHREQANCKWNKDLAKKIAADVTQKCDTLIAKEETQEERIEKIRKTLGDKRRPVILVKIAEQHFGQRVIPKLIH